jgi:PAS domain S-box-containing protein
MGIDITERKRAEEALAVERQRLFDVLETMPAYVALLAPDHTVPFANQEFVRRFGEAEEGQRCYEFLFGRQEPCPDCRSFKVFDTNQPEQWEWLGPDGRIYAVYDYPFCDTDGSPLVLEMGVDITDRKRAEEALKQNEAMLRLILETLPVGVWVADKEGQIIQGNPASQKIWAGARYVGVEQYGEYKGWWADSGQRIEAEKWALARAVQKGETSLGEVIDIECFDGSRKTIINSAVPLFGENQEILGAIVVNQDITEMKRVEKVMKEQARQLEAFFGHSLTPIVFLDLKFNFLRVNEAYARACRREVPEFIGHNHFEFYPHEENEAIFAGVVRTKTPYQALARPFIFPDHPEWGVTYWDWSLAPILDDRGAVDFLVFSLNDVTQRVLAEEKKAQLHEIMEATPDLVGTADTSGRVFYLNQAGRRMLGLGENEELAHATIADFHPPETSKLIYSQAIPTSRREGVWQGETKLRSRDGREIPISQVILAHRTPEGAVRFYSTIARDISDLKQAEEKLRLLTSQLLKAQEDERRRLSRELHDELGQSLLVLKMQTRTIERQLPPGQDALREDCSRALKYIDEIIDNVRRLSRDLSPAILEDLGLSAALNYLFDEFRRHHAGLNFFVEQELLDEYISKEGQMNIFRIVQESLTNIAKHAQASQVKVSLKKQGDMLVGVVEDDGEGFAVSELPAKEVYERGLGLAAMDERVRIMDGSLHLSSERGKGTKVAFQVPLGKGV